MSIEGLKGELRPVLVAAGIVFPDDELALILQAATGLPGSELLGDVVVESSAASTARSLARRRGQGEPLPYVTGIMEFRSLQLAVGPGVFIPRPGTGAVVERAEAVLPRGGLVADICTGCGTIAFAIASERPDARVYASDSSDEALAWAQENRSRTELQVTFCLGDLFDPLPGELRGEIDVVVANPPHVPSNEAHLMPRDVVDHEPSDALFGGPDGLLITERIVSEAVDWLKPGGWLVCELGGSQDTQVTPLLESLGYTDIAVHLDESNRRRVIEARLRR
jgi:release factor glutamine methyltransferase